LWLYAIPYGIKMPADVEDSSSTPAEMKAWGEGKLPIDMSRAIHLFKLANLNAEIEYVHHNISREPP